MRMKIEFEGKQIQELFLQNLGTAEQISQRQEVRLSRISTIETEILDLQKARKAKVRDISENILVYKNLNRSFHMKGLSSLLKIIRQPSSVQILFSQSYNQFIAPVRKFILFSLHIFHLLSTYYLQIGLQ